MATLKISDLSVGDWVKMGDERYQIYHLTLAGDAYGYRKVNTISGEEYFDGSIADVCPIPITAEILEKNGFEENCGIFYNSDILMEFEQYKDGWDRTINCGEYSVYFIKYVHQLQHTLRIAGVEKEINL